LIVTFDTKEKTFRHEMDANYKAHREAAPDDFYPQVPFLYEFLEACEVQTLMKPGFESDDLIGTIATEAEKEDYDVYILSGDLDFLQLVSDKVKLAKFNGKLEDSIMYGPVETEARYGIKTDQMIDFKAICGDSSDNYKGVAGVGPKGAEKLLNEFKTLEDIYENLDKLAPKSKEKFEKDRDYVFHCKKLAEIHTSVDIEYEFEKFHFAPETTKEFFEKMNFKSLLGRYEKVLRDYDKPPVEIKKKEPEEDKQMAMF
ncbi:MAG: DNA polymerase I, partial [Candidatus Peregrinibacteria bacterium]|nr:DNA polymerase I [Candidatus Peregrinibacteria bacterium]